MILTLTPNPTIDRAVFCRDFCLGEIVRAERELMTPSGKGVDASLVLRELGGETRVLGLAAGLNGRLHAELLDRWGIAHDMVPALGETRMAIVLVDLAVMSAGGVTVPVYDTSYVELDSILAKTMGYETETDTAWRENILLPMAISNYADEDDDGLWNSLPATLVVELGIFAVGVWLYLRTTRALDRVGTVGLWSLIGFLLMVYFSNLFGPPPPSAMAIAWLGQAQWLLVIWAFWIDRHRAVDTSME